MRQTDSRTFNVCLAYLDAINPKGDYWINQVYTHKSSTLECFKNGADSCIRKGLVGVVTVLHQQSVAIDSKSDKEFIDYVKKELTKKKINSGLW